MIQKYSHKKNEKFLEVVNTYLQEVNNNFKIEYRGCPDQCVGSIFIETKQNQNGRVKTVVKNLLTNSENNDFKFRDSLRKLPKESKKIFLILESPHIDEYKGDTAPAKGKTGLNIRNYLNLVVYRNLDKFVIDTEYKVVLINAIQYQCSLGVKKSPYRNEVFLRCWAKFGHDDFVTRLKSRLNLGDIIINAATKGDKNSEIRMMVEKAIKEVNTKGSDIKVKHPSTWDRLVNEVLKRTKDLCFNWGNYKDNESSSVDDIAEPENIISEEIVTSVYSNNRSSHITKEFRTKCETELQNFPSGLAFLQSFNKYKINYVWLSTKINAHLYHHNSLIAYIIPLDNKVFFYPKVQGKKVEKTVPNFTLLFDQIFPKYKNEIGIELNKREVIISNNVAEDFFDRLIEEIKNASA